eukprot:TRINITY_DN15251_c0_g1_i1.p1 TRINITY_DN15251_c0_g1~~TRINITY_DN15251_c0_g1_i1.p1  ORF type:complete len:101 (-),score=0.18 TRINITY_DN15251_c0_g1_i1:355-657(-)
MVCRHKRSSNLVNVFEDLSLRILSFKMSVIRVLGIFSSTSVSVFFVLSNVSMLFPLLSVIPRQSDNPSPNCVIGGISSAFAMRETPSSNIVVLPERLTQR